MFSFGDMSSEYWKLMNYHDNSCSFYPESKDNEHSDGFDRTAPVKSFPPNPWGLYEMHGNLNEWCDNNLHEPEKAVVRGGSWHHGAKDARSANRADEGNRGMKYHSMGFRVMAEE